MLRRFQDAEEFPLLRVIGLGGVAGGGADAAVLFLDEFVGGEDFLAAEAPDVAGFLVHALGEGFGEAVAEGFDDEGGVVIVLSLEFLGEGVDFLAGGDGEGTDGIDTAGFLGRDEVGQGVVRLALGFLGLLAEGVEGGEDVAVLVVEIDVVAVALRAPEGEDAAGGEELFLDDLLQEDLRVVEEGLGLGADEFVLEDGGVAATQFPRVEEG